MNLDEQKKIILAKLKSDEGMKIDLKEKFEKQILAMSDEELTIFFESMKEVVSENELREKILKMYEMEKNNHAEYMQAASEFSKNITSHESENQKNIDKSKADSLLNQIKSL